MIPILDAFCAANKGSKWFLAGAGAEEGELTLTIWDDLQGSSVLVDESNELIHTGKQRKIPIITIDSLLEKGEIHIPQLCKLDIQGFELEALKGATKLFDRTEVFILEVSLFDFNVGTPSFYEVVRFMGDRDYMVYDFPGYAYRPLDSALGQVDMCFVKKNGILRKSHQW